MGLVSDEADKIILKIRETIDPEKRRALHNQFQRLLMKEFPYLFLWCKPQMGAYNPRFHGVRFFPKRPGYNLWEWYDSQAE